MGEVKLEECCLENKQSTAASSSSVSDGSGSAILKSPGTCSPAPTSPSNRYYAFMFFTFVFSFGYLCCCSKFWDQIFTLVSCVDCA